ncbi:hypothetical protein ACFVXH_40110 [Kitasatospora sp. NPDC058184]|uniref:hypothetical protein n=1 Tax=Kitasatospora sp. NPDC058184 TaxID=3346370 RepID=UPI0036D9B72A
MADGLSTGEGAFLLACCNHTDDRGYVIASMRQLADEAHMKETAAKSNKQKLIKRGLLAAKQRYSPKNGAQIADLYRVNLPLLASMKRARTDYGPSLVEELTFADPHETPSSDPGSESDLGVGHTLADPPADSDPGGSESDPGGSESAGGAGSESDPLLLPSSSPSSLSTRAGTRTAAATQAPDERESQAAPQESTAGAGGDHTCAATLTPASVDVPAQRETGGQPGPEAQEVLAAYEAALGGPALPGVRARLLGQATELLRVRPLWWLVERAGELPQWGEDLEKHCAKSKKPFTKRPAPRTVADPCPSHPNLEAAGCRHCAADAVVDRQRRALDEQMGIDDESSRRFMAEFLAQARQPRTPADRRRDAAQRQAEEARRQSAKRAGFLAG